MMIVTNGETADLRSSLLSTVRHDGHAMCVKEGHQVTRWDASSHLQEACVLSLPMPFSQAALLGSDTLPIGLLPEHGIVKTSRKRRRMTQATCRFDFSLLSVFPLAASSSSHWATVACLALDDELDAGRDRVRVSSGLLPLIDSVRRLRFNSQLSDPVSCRTRAAPYRETSRRQ